MSPFEQSQNLRERVSAFVRVQLDRFREREEGRFFLWLPVFLGLGIVLYFSLRFEPDGFVVGGLYFALVLTGLAVMRYGGWVILPVILLSVASGFVLAKVRSELVRAPVLAKEKGFFVVEGRLERLSVLPGKEKRLHLVDLSIKGLNREKTPARIRITSRIKDGPLFVGARIRVRAVLRPPPGPVRPGGFDFARQAWFDRLGAVGFAVSRVTVLETAPDRSIWSLSERVRQQVFGHIKAGITGAAGDIAAALVVGEKKSIAPEILEDIRASGLAHMLAISGMHMALVSGTMYWFLRAVLALSRSMALLFDVRKFAAIGAILVAAAYYLLSGMGISTLRAFIMISIMFMAVLLGRKALSLRNVSLAALLILIFRPESLLEVGFQMSFASVVALIAFYESGVFNPRRGGSSSLVLRWTEKAAGAVLAIFATTLVAGLAVAPIAVYHFHHITTYSVVGNVLAMPVLSLVVMPAALVAMISLPFDLHMFPLGIMGWGIDQIIAIANYVAGFSDARVNVGTIGLLALLLIVAGGLWLCLWQSVYRYGGLVLIAAGLALSLVRPTPFLLVEREGRNLVLIDSQKAMWPLAPRAGRYSLDRWQSAFGATIQSAGGRKPLPQARRGGGKKAAPLTGAEGTGDEIQRARNAKSVWRCDGFGCTALHEGLTIAYSSHPGALEEDCSRADILIATYPVSKKFAGCRRVRAVIDIRTLKRHGSHALYLEKGRLRMVNSREIRGQRPWSRHYSPKAFRKHKD